MPKQRPHRSKQNYATPPDFMRAVKTILDIGAFTFDFAADKTNTKAPFYWGEKDNSLAQSRSRWRKMVGEGWGWLNPPYTDIGAWAERCAQLRADEGKVALLVPASVGANWYRDFVHPYAQVYALNGRICFDPDRSTWGYPKDCILALYDPAWEPGFDVWTWHQSLSV